VTSVQKEFGGLRAVAGATFAVPAGQTTALIGPNGAGKSTLFDVITGFTRPNEGSIRFGGSDITGWRPHRIARAGLVRTFQTTKTLRKLTVIENLLAAAPDHPGDRVWPVFLTPGRVRSAESAARAAAEELLDRVHLDGLANEYAGVLSGGQRKLLELARALMLRPQLLLLDEPFAGVNPVLAAELSALLDELRKRDGITLLFVEHDMHAVMTLADRVVVMNAGTVLMEGAPDEVRRDPRVIDAYLGVAP
jgi:ABC-type branched-subunit amino acid transport system ATPase component